MSSVVVLSVAAPSRAFADERPNILFCISDDQSYPHCSAYGCDWVRTPAFDRVAENGILFTRCYTPNAKCAPSRSIVLTGRNSWQLGAAANHVPYFPVEQPVYTEALAAAGYFVGQTGKGWSPGTALDASGETRHLTGTPYTKKQQPPPTTAISNNDYAGNFADFLNTREQSAGDAPFCFWFGATEPHRSYEYGSGVSKGGKRTDSVDRVPAYWPDNETVRNDVLDYALEIEHFDKHLGLMLDELESRGLLENTLVVVTSDNGMPFPRAKGQTFEISHHMPLAIMWPAGIQDPGRVNNNMVSFIHFAPTFVDVAGVAPATMHAPDSAAGPPEMTGRSLRPIFESAGNVVAEANWDVDILLGKERHDLGRPKDAGYPSRGLIDERFLYIKNYRTDRWPAGNPETGYMNTDGGATKTEVLNLRRAGTDRHYWDLCFGRRPEIELYDLKADPDCVVNVAGKQEWAQIEEAMADRLGRKLLAQGDPRETGEGPDFDSFPYSRERTRGYYEKFTSGWKDERGRSLSAGWINPTDVETEPVESATSE